MSLNKVIPFRVDNRPHPLYFSTAYGEKLSARRNNQIFGHVMPGIDQLQRNLVIKAECGTVLVVSPVVLA